MCPSTRPSLERPTEAIARRGSRFPQRRHPPRWPAAHDEAVAAAPHLFDDCPIASPELALVDADLAAQLRAELATGEAFRPRHVLGGEYPTLVFDAVVRDLDEEPLVDVLDELPDSGAASADADTGEDVGADPPSPPVLEALPTPEEQTFELPDYIVVSDDEHVDSIPDVVVPPEQETFPALPEYVVSAVEDALVEDDLPEAIPTLQDPSLELPDYIVLPDEETSLALPEYVVPAADEVTVEDVVPEYVVHDDDVVPVVDEAPANSAYPVLPDLNERSDALEETEAALRRIREQMVVVPPSEPKRGPRLRRRFTILAGLCAVTATAVVAAEMQLGVAHASGWIAF
jgi:hypothetical protein